MKNFSRNFFIFISILSMLLLVSCNDSSFKSSSTGERKQPPPVTTPIVNNTQDAQKTPVQPLPPVVETPVNTTPKDPCEGSLLTNTTTVNFPATGNCPWGQNGNLNPQDGRVSGRIEQTFPVTLPQNSIICNWKMEFPPQGFSYDDYILLAFNNRILLSSNGVGTPPTGQDFNIYTWDAYRNGLITGGSNYCVGKDKGLSDCPVLANRQDEGLGSGTFFLNLDPSIVKKLGQVADSENKAEFLFVTSGDNDDTDCMHSDVTFSIEISYANK